MPHPWEVPPGALAPLRPPPPAATTNQAISGDSAPDSRKGKDGSIDFACA